MSKISICFFYNFFTCKKIQFGFFRILSKSSRDLHVKSFRPVSKIRFAFLLIFF